MLYLILQIGFLLGLASIVFFGLGYGFAFLYTALKEKRAQKMEIKDNQELIGLRQRTTTLTQEIALKNKKIYELETKEKDLVIRDGKIQNLEEKVEVLMREKVQIEQRAHAKSQNLESELAEAKQCIQEYEQKVQLHQHQTRVLFDLEKKLQEKESEVESLKLELEKKTEPPPPQEDYSIDRISQLEKAVESQGAILEAKEKLLEKLKYQLDQEKDKTSASERRVSEMQQLHQLKDAEIELFKEQVAELSKKDFELAQLRNELEEVVERNKALAAGRSVLEERLEAQEANLQAFPEKIEELERENKKYGIEIDQLQRALDESIGMIDELRSKKPEVVTQPPSYAFDKNDLEEKIRSLEEQLHKIEIQRLWSEPKTTDDSRIVQELQKLEFIVERIVHWMERSQKTEGSVKKPEGGLLLERIADLEQEIFETNQKSDSLLAELSSKLDPTLVGEDDLCQIRGIGPYIKKILQDDFGITTFKQIAFMDAVQIAAISKKLFFRDRIQRDDWVGQAVNLHMKKHHEALNVVNPPYFSKYLSAKKQVTL